MSKTYYDSEFKCHTSNTDGKFHEFHVQFFDNKCQTFVEGYRYIPPGESWTRSDGTVFGGEMIAPWKPFDELDNAQREYERQQLADAENALGILLGGELA